MHSSCKLHKRLFGCLRIQFRLVVAAMSGKLHRRCFQLNFAVHWRLLLILLTFLVCGCCSATTNTLDQTLFADPLTNAYSSGVFNGSRSLTLSLGSFGYSKLFGNLSDIHLTVKARFVGSLCWSSDVFCRRIICLRCRLSHFRLVCFRRSILLSVRRLRASSQLICLGERVVVAVVPFTVLLCV